MQATARPPVSRPRPAAHSHNHHHHHQGGVELSKDPCHRCKRATYFNDKIGPLKDGAHFHKGCFKCWICGSRLTLKTYFHNRCDTQDLEIYCAGHTPTGGPHDPIPHRSNLLYSPKTKGEYPHNLMRSAF